MEYFIERNKFKIQFDNYLLVFYSFKKESGCWKATFKLYYQNDPSKEPVLVVIDQINLESLKRQNEIAKHLYELFPYEEDPTYWQKVIRKACFLAIEKYLQNDAPIILEDTDEFCEISQPDYLIYPFIYKDQTNLFFGMGSTFKSFFALYCALLLEKQNNFTLYLDYETNKDEIERRKRILGLKKLFYWECNTPITEDYRIDTIADFIEKNDIKLLILDSIAPALGSMNLNEAATADALFSVLRCFKTTILLIGHQSKGDGKYPFGSVFFFNLPRHIWRTDLQITEDKTSLLILTNIKNNLGKLHKPQFFKVLSDENNMLEFIQVSENDYFNELQDYLPVKTRVIELLKQYPSGLSFDEICEILNEKPGTIKRILYRNKHIFEKKNNVWELKNQ